MSDQATHQQRYDELLALGEINISASDHQVIPALRVMAASQGGGIITSGHTHGVYLHLTSPHPSTGPLGSPTSPMSERMAQSWWASRGGR